jgi:DNA transformation protein
MKVGSEYLSFVMDKLSPIGEIKSPAMFGGYGIFHQGLMFALISRDTLHFKVTESNRDMYERAQSKPFPHGISYWEVPADVLENEAKLHEWANSSIGIAQEAARKKRGKSKQIR